MRFFPQISPRFPRYIEALIRLLKLLCVARLVCWLFRRLDGFRWSDGRWLLVAIVGPQQAVKNVNKRNLNASRQNRYIPVNSLRPGKKREINDLLNVLRPINGPRLPGNLKTLEDHRNMWSGNIGAYHLPRIGFKHRSLNFVLSFHYLTLFFSL